MSMCSTMWVGRQSRRVCFGAKPDKGVLDMKSRRIRKWEGDAREAVDGGPGRESRRRDPGAERQWRLDSREASSRELAAGEQKSEAAWDRVQRQWVKMSLLLVNPKFVRVCSSVLLFSPFPRSYFCVVARNVRYPLEPLVDHRPA